MTEQPRLTPPSAPDEPVAPAWGSAPAVPAPPAPAAYPAYPGPGIPASYQQVTGHQTHQGGLWSMVLGIIGLVCGVLSLPTSGLTALGMVCSPVAFGLGLWSSRVIRDQPHVYNNRGQAIAGWVLGLVGMVLAVLALLVVLAFVVLVIWFFAEVEDAGSAA